MQKYRAAKVTIDLKALAHNFKQVKKYSPDSFIMPVIKANAYGHGLLPVAQTLKGADAFAVAQLNEALALRNNGVDLPIVVLQGFSSAFQLQEMFKHNIRPVISQHWQLELLSLKKQSSSIDIWIKINTGMGRLGFAISDIEEVYQRLIKIKSVSNIGFMMHFANADVPDHPSNQNQMDRFLNIIKPFNIEISASNSAAIINGWLKQQNWVRPGIMLYGVSPIQNKTAVELNLKPVMTLTAELIAINQLKKHETVGYGDKWVCPEDMRVGIVNIGYADGYPRHADAAPVMVNGQQCRIIGRVSMDSIAVDLREISACCGDSVECWGAQLPVEEVAANAQTIAYELLCHSG